MGKGKKKKTSKASVEKKALKGKETTSTTPSVEQKRNSQLPEISTSSSLDRGKNTFSGKKVLVVVDNQLLRKEATGILSKYGAVVVECENGVNAFELVWEFLREHRGLEPPDLRPYDCILMGCEMPVLDGYETTLLIREVEKEYGIHLPIISLSEKYGLTPEDINKTLEVGIDSVMIKPFPLNAVESGQEVEDFTSSVEQKKKPVGNKEKKPLSGKKVLLAEDDIMLCIEANILLCKFGATVDVCLNGEEAYDQNVSVMDIPYDYILMDCQMPVMDGYKAAKLIRKDEKQYGRIRIPIIALTENNNALTAGELKEVKDAEMDFIIKKPLKPEHLNAITNLY